MAKQANKAENSALTGAAQAATEHLGKGLGALIADTEKDDLKAIISRLNLKIDDLESDNNVLTIAKAQQDTVIADLKATVADYHKNIGSLENDLLAALEKAKPVADQLHAANLEISVLKTELANVKAENATLNNSLNESKEQYAAFDLEENSIVPTAQLQRLLSEIKELRDDIGPLINVFAVIFPLVKDDFSIAAVWNLINVVKKDKNLLASMGAIMPILKKYIQTPETV